MTDAAKRLKPAAANAAKAANAGSVAANALRRTDQPDCLTAGHQNRSGGRVNGRDGAEEGTRWGLERERLGSRERRRPREVWIAIKGGIAREGWIAREGGIARDRV